MENMLQDGGGSVSAPIASARSELACTGTLRVGVVYAPEASAFFVTRGADGDLTGVTVDLGAELARALGVPAMFVGVPGSGELVDALEEGRLDVAFMPVDEPRKMRIDFGPDYYVVDSTCLVGADTQLTSIDALNHPTVRVVGIAETTTIRAAQHALPEANFKPVSSVTEALQLLREQAVEAVALSRDVLESYQSQFPGSRVLDGAFHTIRIAVALAKGKPHALDFVTAFMKYAKDSGIVQRALDRAGA
jgi:polar amino acid transport system substrate-binding protein